MGQTKIPIRVGATGESFSLPNYKRVEGDLRTRLREGYWTSGEMLPSRVALATQYGIDLRTLQRAITPLLEEGLLTAKVPNGTFVANTSATGLPQVVPWQGRRQRVLHGRRMTNSSRSSLTANPLEKQDAQRTPSNVRANLGIICRSYNAARVSTRTYFHDIVIEAMERVIAEQIGASLHYCDRKKPDGTLMTIPEAVDDLRKAGINLLAVVFEKDDDDLRVLEETVRPIDLPTIAVGWHSLSSTLSHAFWDSTYAGYQAAEYLINSGYESLLFFAPFEADWAVERIAGARIAAIHANLPSDLLQVVYNTEKTAAQVSDDQDEFAHASARIIIAEQLARPGVGVIAVNDHTARGFQSAAAEIGKTAGRDYGLIGFDDLLTSRQAGLTSLHPPLAAIGHDVAEALLETLQGKPLPKQIRLRSYVVPRASTLRP